MNTRLLPGIAVALLAVVVLVGPAAAQDDAEADTIYVRGDQPIVIVGEDGRRIIVRSADDVDRPFFFDGPSGRWRAPRVAFRGHAFGEDDADNFAVLSDYLGNMDNVFVDGFGDDFTVHVGESMKGRSEIMRMEMESQRLARRARRADDDDERAQLEEELHQKLTEIFDRKQALREERVQQLQEALNKALEQQSEREQSRHEIIDRRLRELLGQRDRYDW